MRRKEVEAALLGDACAGFVVTCPLIAAEAVLRTWIGVDLDVGSFGADDVNVAERTAYVFFTEMKLGRHLRLVVGKANDGAAVIADRRGQA